MAYSKAFRLSLLLAATVFVSCAVSARELSKTTSTVSETGTKNMGPHFGGPVPLNRVPDLHPPCHGYGGGYGRGHHGHHGGGCGHYPPFPPKNERKTQETTEKKSEAGTEVEPEGYCGHMHGQGHTQETEVNQPEHYGGGDYGHGGYGHGGYGHGHDGYGHGGYGHGGYGHGGYGHSGGHGLGGYGHGGRGGYYPLPS